MIDSNTFSQLQPLPCPRPNNRRQWVIAGPCSAESREQVLDTARALSRMGVGLFRAGVWKPRTSPDSFAGHGQIALDWLMEAERTTGLTASTEVATPEHVVDALNAGLRWFWIGARTTANPFAVQAIADALAQHGTSNITILVKNPINPDLELWIGALQRLYNAGIKRLGAIHRGFSTFASNQYRNDPQWQIPIELKRRIPTLTVFCDPSHMGGRTELIAPLSQQALDMGFDGLMIECHCNPAVALSDKEQQITPTELQRILESLVVRNHNLASDNLSELRQQIDLCDDQLLDIMKRRLDLCCAIGRIKKDNNISIVQAKRYDEILKQRIEQATQLHLDPQFVQSLMQLVHHEAVRLQLDILNNSHHDDNPKMN